MLHNLGVYVLYDESTSRNASLSFFVVWKNNNKKFGEFLFFLLHKFPLCNFDRVTIILTEYTIIMASSSIVVLASFVQDCVW